MSELEKQRNQLKELSKGLTFDEQQRRQHELDHTALLSGYTKYQLGALKYKNCYKLGFFVLCSVLLLFPVVFVVIVYCGIHNGWLPADTYSTVAAIVAAALGLVADVAVLPGIMGEYFFNKEEDKNIVQLFSNAQKNDQYHDKKEVDRQEVLRKLRGN